MITLLIIAVVLLLIACVVLLVALHVVVRERDELVAAVERVRLGRAIGRSLSNDA